MSRKFKGVLSAEETSRMTSEQLRGARQNGWLPAIAGGALESNINGLWVARQTGRGSPADMSVGTKRMRWISGDLQTNRADGTQGYSDDTLFGNTVDYVNTLIGNGTPAVQGQPGVAAYLLYLAGGQETVTGGTNAVQTIPASTATGGTFKLKLGDYETAAIAFDATAAAVQSALLAATNANGDTVPAGTIAATGGPVNTTPTAVTFSGALGHQAVPLMTVDGTSLTGGTLGALTATTAGTGFTHVATPSDNGGFWSTWVKSVGKTVVHRSQFNDCRITQMDLEGSSANKVFQITPTFMSLDPGVLIDADPTQVDDAINPFIYTEASGTFTIDGNVFRGHSAFSLSLQWGLTEWYGDDVTAFDVVNTTATVQLNGITIILDAQGLAFYNNLIYGTPTPEANAKPKHDITGLGSYSCKFTKVNPVTGGEQHSLEVTIPSVKWSPDLAIPANPAGGPVEFALAAEFRKTTTDPAYTITTVTSDAAYSS